jgi:PAS domain S-box-containing protein
MEDAVQTEEAQRIEISSQASNAAEKTFHKRSLRILHVDDDPCLLDVSKQILSMEPNFEIDTAISVDEAFRKMEKQTYDVVVSDYEMPLRNGLDFLKELREQGKDVPFILFTGKGREEVVVKALNLGADRYINKYGPPETVYCELTDAINKIVDRKKATELLLASESKYRTLVETSLEGILVTKADPLRLVFANKAMGKILGYSVKELLSLSPERIMGCVYPEDRAVFFKRVENRFRGEPAESCLEFRAVRKDGSIIWLNAFANRVDYDGQPAVLGMFLNVNESKKAEEILRESEKRYRELANCLPEIVFETDMNGRLVFANERAAEISGYSQKELEKGLNIMQFLVPEDREKAAKNIQRLLSGGGYVPAEYSFVRKNGSSFPALIMATPRICENKFAGLRGLVIDITERKREAESLEKEKQELNRILDSAPLIIFYKDKEGKFIRVNKTFAEASKIPKEDFLGKTVFDLYSAEIAQSMTNDDLEVLTSRCPRLGIIEQYESASGLRWVQTDKIPVLDKNGVPTGLIGFAQDITEHKSAEKALQTSEEKLRMIFEGASDGIIAADSKTKSFVFANPRICEITGYSLEELLKLNISDIHPEKDLPSVTEQFMLQLRGEITLATNIPVLRKDGTVVYCDVNARPAKFGEQEYLVGFFRDITDRKKAEEALNRTMDELVRVNEKIGVVGSLTRHDVRNKLVAVAANAFIIKKKHPDHPDIIDGLGKMEQAVKDIVKIFDFAKTYEELGVEELTYIDVEKTLKESVALFSGALNVEVINECHGLVLLADSFLRQLFYNLIDNSLKHGQKVSRIRVRFEKVDQDKLIVVYEDDGVGVPEVNKRKLFKEGFSTGGSGYGLYLIRKMVEVYGWAIREDGEPGVGAKFIMTISKTNPDGKDNFKIA